MSLLKDHLETVQLQNLLVKLPVADLNFIARWLSKLVIYYLGFQLGRQTFFNHFYLIGLIIPSCTDILLTARARLPRRRTYQALFGFTYT